MKHTRSLRAARIGTAGLAAAAVATVALAAPALALGPGNIDPDAAASLTIHKYVTPDDTNAAPHFGQELTGGDLPGTETLEGVEFTVEHVTGIDLTTGAGWDIMADLEASDAADHGLETIAVSRTDANGVIELTGLDVGVYLVTETDRGPHPILAYSAPFLVTLPAPEGEGSWNYDVHAYPKNSLSGITKSVDDENAFVGEREGDTVTWKIEVEAPRLPDAQVYTRYAVVDDLDERLAFEAVRVLFTDSPSPARILEEGRDYTATTPAIGAAGEVEIVLTQLMLDTLGRGSQDFSFTVEIDTTVLESGVIPNEATVIINDPSNSFDSNEVETPWGDLRVIKHAADDEAQRLEGAQFAIYNQLPAEGVEPIASFTTSAAGTATQLLKAGDYFVVETAAPAGYQLDDTVHPVTVVAEGKALVTLTIANEQVPAYMLPLTGGNGTALFLAGGLAVMLIAAGALVVVRRRQPVAA